MEKMKKIQKEIVEFINKKKKKLISVEKKNIEKVQMFSSIWKEDKGRE